jgi:hypothetical protein
MSPVSTVTHHSGRAATDVPELAERVVASLACQVGAVQEQLAKLEQELLA